MFCFGSCLLSSDIHGDVSFYESGFTLTATEHNVCGRCITFKSRTHGSAQNCHYSIALQHTIGIATAIDGIVHRTAKNVDFCVAKVLSRIIICYASQTATEDVSGNRAVKETNGGIFVFG